MTFRLADPLTEDLTNLRTVEDTFTSGDFTLADVVVGEDLTGDLEVRGNVTYGGAEAVEATLEVVIDGSAGNLGRAFAARTFEPGETAVVAFVSGTEHTDDDVVLGFEATVDEVPDVAAAQAPSMVPLPGDRVVDGVTFTSIRLVRDYDGDVAMDVVGVASEGGSAYDGEIQAQVLSAGEVVATVTGYATLAPGQATTVYLSGSDDFAEPLDDVRFTLFRR